MGKNKALMKWANKQVKNNVAEFVKHNTIPTCFLVKTDKKCFIFGMTGYSNVESQNIIVEKIKGYIKNLKTNGHKLAAGMFIAPMFYFVDGYIEKANQYNCPTALIPGAKFGLMFQLDLINSQQTLVVDVNGTTISPEREWVELSECDSPFMGLLEDNKYDPSVM